MERSLHNCWKRSTIASFMIALTAFRLGKAIIAIHTQHRIRTCVFVGILINCSWVSNHLPDNVEKKRLVARKIEELKERKGIEMKKILLLLLGVLIIFALVGCGTDVPPPIDEAIDETMSGEVLVGTWRWANNTEWEYVFEADGTGTQDGEMIIWSVEDDALTLIRYDETEEVWSYVIDGNMLALTNTAGTTFYYIQYGTEPTFLNSHAIIGVWQNVDNSADLFVFEAGGGGVNGSAADPHTWWTIGDSGLVLDMPSHETLTLVLGYQIDGEYLTLSARQSDGEWNFVWLGEDLDSIIFPTDMLENLELLLRLAQYVTNLEFTEIVVMVDAYLAEVNATEEDIAHEVRELAVRAAELLEETYVYVDSFDGRITVYYPGVRAISSDINILPYIRPGTGRISPTRPRASANFHLDFGFYRRGWLFFDRASLRMSDDSIWDNNFGPFETNRDVIRGGTIREVGPKDWSLVSHSTVARLFERMDVDYDHVLRFTNRDEDNHIDFTLSDLEIIAVSTLAELHWLMAQLGHRIPNDFS